MKVKVIENIKKEKHPNCASNLFDVSINISNVDYFTMGHIVRALQKEATDMEKTYKVFAYGDETHLAGNISIKPMEQISHKISMAFGPKYNYFIRKQMDEMLLKYQKGQLKNITHEVIACGKTKCKN